MERLRFYFGHRVLLFLNTESALTMILRNLPDREPGMLVGLDARHSKRFGKIIERVGLRPVTFSGQKSLASLLSQDRILCVIVPDHYEVASPKYRNIYNSSTIVKIVFQNRKKARSVAMQHDIYLWEPRNLPRTVSGAVCVLANESVQQLREVLRTQNSHFVRLKNSAVRKDLRYAMQGKENRYRRVDRRPARILPKMLYDFYK